MRHSYFDVLLAILLAVVSAMLIALRVNVVVVRVVIGFLLVFILPGYVLSVVLFPEPAWHLMERVVLTVGLSLIISILGGLVLYSVSIRLQDESWMLYFGLVVLIFGGIAIVRRLRLPQIQSRRISDTRPVKPGFIVPSFKQLLLIGLSTLIVLGSVALAQKVASSNPRTEIVQLWILPGDQNNGYSIRIGAMANEAAPSEFSLWLGRDGYTIQEWPKLVLKPGEKWEAVISLDSRLAGSGPLDAYLYLYGQPNIPYRHVNLWLDQLGSSK